MTQAIPFGIVGATLSVKLGLTGGRACGALGLQAVTSQWRGVWTRALLDRLRVGTRPAWQKVEFLNGLW